MTRRHYLRPRLHGTRDHRLLAALNAASAKPRRPGAMTRAVYEALWPRYNSRAHTNVFSIRPAQPAQGQEGARPIHVPPLTPCGRVRR